MHPPLHDSFPTTLYPLSLLFIVEQLPIIWLQFLNRFFYFEWLDHFLTQLRKHLINSLSCFGWHIVRIQICIFTEILNISCIHFMIGIPFVPHQADNSIRIWIVLGLLKPIIFYLLKSLCICKIIDNQNSLGTYINKLLKYIDNMHL